MYQRAVYRVVSQISGFKYRAVEPDQGPQRHPEVRSSWPSWPKASQTPDAEGVLLATLVTPNVGAGLVLI